MYALLFSVKKYLSLRYRLQVETTINYYIFSLSDLKVALFFQFCLKLTPLKVE